jgi:hypothetical protein
MPDFSAIASALREQMHATLSRSDVLKPLAWLVLILASALIVVAVYSPHAWLVSWLLALLIVAAAIYSFAYLYCLFKDRDALRSEKYSLQKLAIEQNLLGDNSVGMFEAQEINKRGPSASSAKQIERQQ